MTRAVRVSAQGAHLWRALYELRLAVGWATLLPVLSFAGGLLITMHLAGQDAIARSEGAVNWSMYLAPLAGALALVPLMVREGQWRTIDLLRSRTEPWQVAVIRGGLALGVQLMGGVVMALAARVLFAPVPLGAVVMLFAPDLWLLATAGMLAAHLLGESAGYTAIGIAWLALTAGGWLFPQDCWVQLLTLQLSLTSLHTPFFLENRLTLVAAGALLFAAQAITAARVRDDGAD